MAIQIQIRRDTAANWTSTDPTLSNAEMGYETDTSKLKFGDGSTAWTGLAYFAGGGGGAVDSVFGRTGTVIAVSDDYEASEVTNAFDKIADDTDDVSEGSSNLYNQTHTGDVTGSVALTIGAGKVTEDMQVLADNTTQDVSSAKHGYAPKGDGTTTKFLNANGTYSIPAGGGGGSTDGWIDPSETWTFSSVDDPTGVITVPSDATNTYSLGMRIKFTNASNVIYGLITALTSTTITFLHEIDPADSQALHLMANSVITDNSYSTAKAPFGFPVNPDKWSVIVNDSITRSQIPPTQNVWYNLGSNSIDVPIGVWGLGYSVSVAVIRAASERVATEITLSTGSNTETNSALTRRMEMKSMTQAGPFSFTVSVIEELTSKTTYYLNMRTHLASMTSIYENNAVQQLAVTAVSVYL